MKRFIIIALALLISDLVHGQTDAGNLQIQNGPAQKNKDGYSKDIFGKDSSGFYVLRYEGKKKYVQHCNNEMIIDKTVEIETQVRDGWHLRFHSAQQIGNQFYLFYVKPTNSSDIDTLFAKKMNSISLKAEGELIQVSYGLNCYKYPGPGLNQITVNDLHSVFYTISSVNNDKLLLITYYREPGKCKNPYGVQLTLLDSQLRVDWKTNFQPNCDGGLIQIQNITIDKAGNCAFTFNDVDFDTLIKTTGLMRKPIFDSYVVSITERGSKISNRKISIPGKFVTDITLSISENNQIITAGFYCEKSSFNRIGAFYMRLDYQTLVPLATSNSDIDPVFFIEGSESKQATSGSQNQSKNTDKSNFIFNLSIVENKNNGSIMLLGERYNIIVGTSAAPDLSGAGSADTYVSSISYEHEDILCLSFDTSGTLNWRCTISKRQFSDNDGGRYASFALVSSGNTLHFIFNDNSANANLTTGPKPEKYKPKSKSDVVVVSLDQSGKMQKQTLISGAALNCDIIPRLSISLSPKQLMVLNTDSGNYWFSKITITE